MENTLFKKMNTFTTKKPTLGRFFYYIFDFIMPLFSPSTFADSVGCIFHNNLFSF